MKPMVPIMRLFADADQTREVGAPPTSARDPHRPGTHISTGPGLSRDRRHIAPVRACVEGHSCLRAQMPLPRAHAQRHMRRPKVHGHGMHTQTTAQAHSVTRSRTHAHTYEAYSPTVLPLLTPRSHTAFFFYSFSPSSHSSFPVTSPWRHLRPTCGIQTSSFVRHVY